MDHLTAIPLIDIRQGSPVRLAEEKREDMRRLCDKALSILPRPLRPLVSVSDAASHWWLRRTKTPYLAEIQAIGRVLAAPGAFTINASYQWACTTYADGALQGRPRLLRTLDWPFAGMGESLVIAHQRGGAGDFYNVTWPGAVGVLTGMAPGRFAAAINLAPLRRRTRANALRHLDHALNAAATLTRVKDPPPDHVLRRVFETAKTYGEAVEQLLAARIARPTLFSLVGTKAGEACVIEHRGLAAKLILGPVAVSNDWQTPEPMWESRCVVKGYDPTNSPLRRKTLSERVISTRDPFDWLVDPVLNRTTRVAVEMDVMAGTVHVAGYEPTIAGDAVTLVARSDFQPAARALA